MRGRINFAILQFIRGMRWLGNKLRLLWRFITGRKVTRATVIADAKSINPGAVILFDYNEMIKFAYEVMIREKLIKPKEMTKLINRGDRVLRARFKNQHSDGKN